LEGNYKGRCAIMSNPTFPSAIQITSPAQRSHQHVIRTNQDKAIKVEKGELVIGVPDLGELVHREARVSDKASL